MTGALRVLIGFLTTVVFLGVGATLYSEEQPLIGGALIALGVLRGVVVAQQARQAWLHANEPEELEDD